MSEHGHSLISSKARIGSNVTIGFGCRIYDNVEIADHCTIGDCCVIGIPSGGEWAGRAVKIGAGATIRSHAAIYEASEFGVKLETGHHVIIREGTIAGENLRVGSHADIEGDCTFGDFCRLHGYAHVGRGSHVGHFVWLYSLTTLTNDPLPPSDLHAPVTIEDGVVVCVGVTLLPGAVLRFGSFITAESTIGGEVPSGAVVSGRPGEIVSHIAFLRDLARGLQHPWMNHFSNAYPPHSHARIQALRDAVLAGRDAFVRTHLTPKNNR
jgi:UDP-3-O-[3-hydroxymyristoyl] glucosamine N-acyltransferase